jgi:probable metal-binding protein
MAGNDPRSNRSIERPSEAGRTTIMIESDTVHGHEIIHLIHHSSPALTRIGLETEVRARFGPEARFHTCSAGAMTLDQLLQFLMSRGKVVEQDGRLHAVMANVCEGES